MSKDYLIWQWQQDAERREMLADQAIANGQFKLAELYKLQAQARRRAIAVNSGDAQAIRELKRAA
ncbi:hypothetical protein Pan216_16830 [Planctomycetes bacterium Pan216]|uniref:Uncharacterized protein n=1 Tax=Kolteria novifilia TaxID=2527975 RepID=A0A518B1H4_9BACT|nr:hypothetical protein Pan216_16830 [Planctomycetes bacterium Pan216]